MSFETKCVAAAGSSYALDPMPRSLPVFRLGGCGRAALVASFGLLCHLSACSSSDSLRHVPLPEEARFFAVAYLRAGALEGSSGIHPVSDLRIEVPDEFADAELVTIGFDDRLLDIPGAEPKLAATQLRPVTGCGAKFPEPIYTSAEIPPLGASWLDETCPLAFGTTHGTEARCAVRLCAPPITQIGCRLELDTAACAINSSVVATVDWRGGVCASPEGDCREADRAGRDGLECDGFEGCPLEINPLGGSLAAEVERVQVTNGPPSEPCPRPDDWLDQWAGSTTFLFDALELDGELLVTSAPAKSLTLTGCRDGSDPRTLTRLDASLRIVASATVPPCLDRLATDPKGDGFLAVYQEASGPRLGRFERDGRVTASEAIDPTMAGHGARTLLIDAKSDRISVILEDVDDPHVQSFFMDSATLGLIESGPRLVAAEAWVTIVGSDRLLLTDPAHTRLVFLDRESGGELESRRINQDRLSFGAGIAVGERIVVPILSDAAAIYVIDESIERTKFFEREAVPYSLAVSEGTIWVGLLTGPGPGGRGLLARYERLAARFEPGYYELGVGLPHRIIPTRDGRMVVLLGNTGELVRVRQD